MYCEIFNSFCQPSEYINITSSLLQMLETLKFQFTQTVTTTKTQSIVHTVWLYWWLLDQYWILKADTDILYNFFYYHKSRYNSFKFWTRHREILQLKKILVKRRLGDKLWNWDIVSTFPQNTVWHFCPVVTYWSTFTPKPIYLQ